MVVILQLFSWLIVNALGSCHLESIHHTSLIIWIAYNHVQ